MSEKIVNWVKAWEGSRKWILHLFAMILLTGVYVGTDVTTWETYAWSIVSLAGSFGVANGLEWIGKGKVTK